jgi:glycosyltransferase involved in cell wall biosynthesis
MRLLFVIHSLRGGGAGRVCAALANGLAERGHAVTVAVNFGEESVWHEAFGAGVELVELGAGHARRSVKPLSELVGRLEPHAVLAFNYQLAVALLAVRMRLRRRGGSGFRLVSRHIVAATEALRRKGVWQRVFVGALVRRLYRRVDLVIAQSEGMLEDLQHRFSIPRERTTVIHNPVLPDMRAAPPELPTALTRIAEAARARGERPPVLLYLGRFKPQKQPLTLLELLERVRHRVPEAVLVAAGHGPLLASFQSEVARRALSDAVFYLGYVLNPQPLFEVAGVTVLTSRYEGFPNVLIDSISRGVPVASFDCPTGPSEIVQSGVNGHLAAPGDIDALAESCARLLLAPADRDTIQESASRFSLGAALDSYEAALHG